MHGEDEQVLVIFETQQAGVEQWPAREIEDRCGLTIVDVPRGSTPVGVVAEVGVLDGKWKIFGRVNALHWFAIDLLERSAKTFVPGDQSRKRAREGRHVECSLEHV